MNQFLAALPKLNPNFFLYALLCLILAGCAGDDFTDLTRYIDEVKARPKGSIEPLPEITVVEPFLFQPDGLRDPFRAIEKLEDDAALEIASGSVIRPNANRRKEELEFYELDTLRMVGTLSMKEGLWGLVRASDGTVHRVQVGHYMGKNFGKIIRILEDKIELMEIVQDSKPGMWREQAASLAISE